MVLDELTCGDGILQSAREWVLWCKTVVYGKHSTVDLSSVSLYAISKNKDRSEAEI